LARACPVGGAARHPRLTGQRHERWVPVQPEAAKKFLAEAGYGPDKPVPPVDLWINREGNNELLFRAVADQLEKAGIPVRLNTSKWPVYRGALEACGGKLKRAETAQTPAECDYGLYRMAG